MSIFSALAQISSATVDAVMSERLRFAPRKPGRNAAGSDDPDREAVEVSGVYREIARDTKLDTSSVGKAMDHRFQTPEKTVSVDVLSFPSVAAFRRGDHVTRLDEPGAPVFEIAFNPESDGRSRLVFTIGPVS